MAIFTGTSGNDSLSGTTGNDTLIGLEGNDTLYGVEGNDSLDGGAGNDFIVGNSGSDSMTGGAGTDIFALYDTAFILPDIPGIAPVIDIDTIADFVVGDAGDQLAMPILGAFGPFGPANPFATGYARLTQSGLNTLVEIDSDGSAGTGTFRTIAILQNVTRSGLTAFNFQGMDPNPVVGTPAADNLVGKITADNIDAGAGNDTVLGMEGSDILYGGDGNDSLDGGAGFDLLYGGLGLDTLVGGADGDNLHGEAGNDNLQGGVGFDNLTGGLGDDLMDGGADIDSANYFDAASGVIASLVTGAVTGGAGNDTLLGIENINGSPYADILTGDANANNLIGSLGNDIVNGGAGNDYISGSFGNDTLTGGPGTDTFAFYDVVDAATNPPIGTTPVIEVDTITDFVAGDAGDIFVALTTVTTNPFANGTARLTQSGADTLVEVDLDGTAGPGEFQTLAVLQNVSRTSLTAFNFGGVNPFPIVGTAGADNLIGTIVGETIYAGAGDDTVAGLAGSDMLYGEDGNDSLDGGAGTDNLFGGLGLDTLVGGADGDQLYGEAGNDHLQGGAGLDNLTGGLGDDLIDGGEDNDNVQYLDTTSGIAASLVTGLVTGGAGNDTLVGIENIIGTSYADSLTGDANANALNGGAGNDTLSGGAGNDFLSGSAGSDILTGGVGTDQFAFFDVAFPAPLPPNTTTVVDIDTITDFVAGDTGDIFNLPSLNFGSNPFATGYARLTQSALDTLVEIDVDGSAGTGAFRTIATLQNVTRTSLTAVNFQGTDPDPIVSTPAADNLVGKITADNIDAGAGNDTVTGLEGNDTLYGGDGNDSLDGGAGLDFLNGGLGRDILVGGADNDQLYGNDGNDTLQGSTGFDNLTGGLGDDLIDGGADSDTAFYADASSGINVSLVTGLVTGGAGNDTLVGVESLFGSSFADRLIGNSTANSFHGGAGNDTIDGGTVLDRINYSDSNFTYYINATEGVNINLSGITGIGNTGSGTVTGGASVGVDTIMNVSSLAGSNYNDTILGSSALIFEQFDGSAGNDTIDGGNITDTLNSDNSNRVGYQNTTGAGITVDFIAGTAIGNVGSNAGSDTLININQVRGSNFNDTLLGSNRTDVSELFEGRNGNDLIDGRGGFDLVRYGAATGAATGGVTVNLVTGTTSGLGVGTDTLLNIEGVYGSIYNDLLIGGNAANGVVYNDGLSEFFRGDAGNDTIDGGQGYDLVDYYSSTAAVTAVLNDNLDGSASDGLGGTDVLRNIEALRGSTLNDTLTGSNTAIFESFEGREGNDSINGLGGTDRVDYRQSRAAVSVNLATGTASDGYGGTDTLANIENVRGSRDFNDVITGSTLANRLEGLGGNDTLSAGDGNDTLEGGAGADSLDGGLGSDLVSYASASSGIQAYFYTTPGTGGGLDGDAAGDTYTNIEGVIGSAFADVLVGAAGIANSLDGGAGDDTLYGEGLDSVLGGAGNDVLFGGQGGALNLNLAVASLETVWGSVVGDTLNAASALTAVTLIGQGGADTMTGGAGDDFLYFDSTDTILGGAGLDWAVATLSAAAVNLNLNTTGFENSWGSTSNDTISGAGASTTVVIIGDVGNDSITGGNATDYLYGFAGNDTLTGGAGGDVLDGGAGSDLFAYANLTGSGFDSIFGFVSGQDKFQFNAASFGKLAGSVLTNGLNFVSGTAPVAAGATPTVLYNTSTGVVSYDLDGSGAAAAVSIAQLAGVPPVTAADFLFV